MPDADCAVELSLDVEGKPSAELASGDEVELQFWARNPGADEVSFALDACAEPVVHGLGDHDLFDACSNRCDETAPREITLQPDERVLLRAATLPAQSTGCNWERIPSGSYSLTFEMPLRGVETCGPTPVPLLVNP